MKLGLALFVEQYIHTDSQHTYSTLVQLILICGMVCKYGHPEILYSTSRRFKIQQGEWYYIE